MSNDAQLGLAAITVNPIGVLRYTATTSTAARTFALNSGALEAAANASVTMNGAAVGGGFLLGPGAFNLTGSTAFVGVTTLASTTINQVGPASVANISNGGSFTVGAGQTLVWNGGTNTSSGRFVVNGMADVSDFASSGQLTVQAGGMLSNAGTPLVLAGGSRTTVNPSGALTTAPFTSIELNGGLLVNNGTISGITNVNYGSLAKGTGVYGVVNVYQGGVYAPGNSPGIVTAVEVHFDNTPVTSGVPTLQIELAGIAPGAQYDQLHVMGQLALAGALAVSLVDSFTPAAGNSFDILDRGSLSGTFATLQLPALSGLLVWNTTQLYTTGILSVGLPGDYNANGVVDAADYVVWRRVPGTYGGNPAGYNTWRANFGQPPESGSGAMVNDIVPEPSTLVLLMFSTACWCLRRGRAA